MKWFIRAYEEFQRAEPLVKIADFYRHLAGIALKEGKNANNLWRIAYMYINEACTLEYPDHCILFVDKGVYDYYRWHLMGIIGYYAGKHQEGKDACLKAIAQNINKEVNEKNLQFYLDAEKKKPETKAVLTKEQFLINTVEQLRKDFPNANENQLVKRATAMWKKRDKK
jgi:hypothetical protein